MGFVMMYTINAYSLSEVQKVFNRYAKKAQAIGLTCSLEVIKEYPKKVTVYANDDITHTQVKVGTAVIDVVDIEIIYPEYKLGDYTVAAVIEHGEKDKNLVYPCRDITIPNKYFTGKGVCEHCKTNHNRVKTVLLIDNNTNEFKQVGTGCLKEYTGVTDIALVGAYKALNCIIENNDIAYGYTGALPTRKYIETFDYLVRCVHLYNTVGYNKDNKEKADAVKPEDITETDAKAAEETIAFFNNMEDTDAFLNNIKVTITNEYCKPNNGFVAYAYVAYLKEKERIEEENKRKNELDTITYYGEVGNKIKDIKVTGRCVAGYDTQFGYTYIYKFKDDEGHIFIWKTTKDIDTDDEGIFVGQIAGTIKEHSEYAGEKQTVLTRCKVAVTV